MAKPVPVIRNWGILTSLLTQILPPLNRKPLVNVGKKKWGSISFVRILFESDDKKKIPTKERLQSLVVTQTAEYGSFRQDLGCAKDQNLGAGAQKMVRCAGKSIPGAQNIFKCA